MDIEGEERISAPRDTVWKALNDLDTLQHCIPGCRSIERTAPGALAAVIRVRFGPVSASFNSEITLSNLNPPESYTIFCEGKGGIAGFGKGSADVVLIEDGEETILHYSAEARLGGKLAQMSSRFIASTAQKLAQRFFADFNAAVSGAQPEDEFGV